MAITRAMIENALPIGDVFLAIRMAGSGECLRKLV